MERRMCSFGRAGWKTLFDLDLVLVLEEVKVMNHLIISILIPVQSKVCYCYILLLFPFVPCTLDVPWYYQLYPYKGSGGNKKLPPCRFSTVGIVRKVLTTTHKTMLWTSLPWWAICPSVGINSVNPPSPTPLTSLEGIGQEQYHEVSYKSTN